ncbi:hypothetical protein IR083_01075 [Dysgonomonas sp. GY75]|uniref:hypothetical protein n=1 Tax=Dysgonomonas sp. GY75 TaxID=2780419 RepID=UPI0018834E95|nr:hypothetical protein [Dysgonomonas sp. GY75]MBF0647408.1 hypothetical protein [Dysgonomonas sp. GY75]
MEKTNKMHGLLLPPIKAVAIRRFTYPRNTPIGVFIITPVISKVCFCMTTTVCHTKTRLAPACCPGLISSKVGNQKKVREGSHHIINEVLWEGKH